MLLHQRRRSKAWITDDVFLRPHGRRSVTGRNICRCLGCTGVNRGSDLGHQMWIVYCGPIVTFLISWGVLYLLLTAQSWDLPSGCDLFFQLSHCSSLWTEIIFLCKFDREVFLNLHTFLILKKQQNPLWPPIIMILSNYNSLPFGLHSILVRLVQERLKSGRCPWTTPPAMGFEGLFKPGSRHNLVWTLGSERGNVPGK